MERDGLLGVRIFSHCHILSLQPQSIASNEMHQVVLYVPIFRGYEKAEKPAQTLELSGEETVPREQPASEKHGNPQRYQAPKSPHHTVPLSRHEGVPRVEVPMLHFPVPPDRTQSAPQQPHQRCIVQSEYHNALRAAEQSLPETHIRRQVQVLCVVSFIISLYIMLSKSGEIRTPEYDFLATRIQ